MSFTLGGYCLKNISELASLDVSEFTTLTTKVSDLISVDAILSMPENSSVFLTVGTGGGKTYFATHNLYQAAQELDLKILIFENRINTITQMDIEIKKNNCNDRITVIGYQAYEEGIKTHTERVNWDEYDIVVLDEYHHINADAILPEAYYTYDVVLKVMQHTCRRFFMSATPRGLDKHIQELHGDEVPYWELKIPMDYSKVYLQGFSSDIQLSSMICDVVDNKQKGIFFLDSSQKALDLHKAYANSAYVCSVYNMNNPMSAADERLRNQILAQQDYLPRQFMFTTTSMDVGVNLYDPKITTVVSNIMDVEQSIQCLGRRRLNPGEMITFYLKNQPLDLIWRKYETLKKQFEQCLFLDDFGQTAYFRHYPYSMDTEKHSVIDLYNEETDSLRRIPVMGRLLYARNYLQTLEEILESNDSYIGYVKKRFGFAEPVEETKLPDFRRMLLDENRGRIFLTAKDRSDFIKELKIVDKYGHSIRGIKNTNTYLKRYDLPYCLEELPRKQIDGKDHKSMAILKYSP